MKNHQILSGALALTLLCGSATPIFATDITVSGGKSPVPVQLTAETAAFSATVPTALPIHVDKYGVVTTADDVAIINNSHAVVKVTNMEIEGKDNWKIVDFDSANMGAEKIGTEKVAMEINGDKTIGDDAITFTQSNFAKMEGTNSSDSDELPIIYDAKVPVQTTDINDLDIAYVTFTVGWDRADATTAEVSSQSELLAAFEDSTISSITLSDDVTVPTAIEITREIELDLNGNTLSTPNDTEGNGVLWVKEGGTLVIDGDGTIDGVGNNNYNMAIWVDGGKVIINDGVITNVNAGSEDHYDLIYVKNGGVVEINGGYFNAETPKWTLNSHDSKPGTFVVKGGTFVGYNPSSTDTEPGGVRSWVATGYKAVEDNGVWTVIKE